VDCATDEETDVEVDAPEVVDATELAETVLAVVAVLAVAAGDETDALGSISETVQALSSCTRASPLGPVTGVKVRVHACIMGPDCDCRTSWVCTETGWVNPPVF
jgi:hypothetical protein